MRLFTTGVESGNTSEFTGVNVGATMDQTHVFNGAWAVACAPSGISAVRARIAGTDQSTAGYMGCWFYMTAYPTAICQMVATQHSVSGLQSRIMMQTTGTLVLQNSAGAAIGSASATPALSTWHSVELKHDASVGPAALAARLNTTIFASGLNNTTIGWIDGRFGPIATSGTTFWLDDFKINDGTGPDHNSWPMDDTERKQPNFLHMML